MFDDGIYFDLPAEEYHADPALGSTSIVLLVKGPVEWWWQSPRNPLYKPKVQTDAMAWGSAFHALILEGEEAFRSQFVKALQEEDFPDVLKGVDDLRAFLKSKGRSAKPYKAEMIQQALEEPDCPPIWDWEKHKFDKRNSGKTVLSEDAWNQVLLSAKGITANPELAPAFQGGRSEIAVFWTVDGVRLKARLDYLKINSLIDLKSFSERSKGRSIEQSIMQAIAGERYDLQAAHYSAARMQIERFLKEGRVFGDHDRRWLSQVAANRDWSWCWIFYKTSGAPISRGIVFDRRSNEFDFAQRQIHYALDGFRECEKRFGDGVWIDETPIQTIGEGDLPPWLGR